MSFNKLFFSILFVTSNSLAVDFQATNLVILGSSTFQGSLNITNAITTSSDVIANAYWGDGSNLTGVTGTGDNLGNHIATMTLTMGGYDITSSSGITGLGRIVWEDGTIQVSSPAAGGGGAGDDLGNHIATMTLTMGNFDIQSSTAISAGYYQINGSTVLAILPGITSMGIGIGAGRLDTVNGNFNLFVGQGAGYNSANFDAITAVGYSACSASGCGGYTALLGYEAGQYLSNGSYNVYVGPRAGYFNPSGAGNIFVGYKAGYGVSGQPQSYNVAVGHQAGMGLSTSGDGNVLLGYQAGNSISTGTYNIIIGYDVDTLAAYTTNYLNIGNAIYGYMNDYSTITFVGAISVTETITRSPIPKTLQEAYDQVDSIIQKVDKPDKLDHDKLHPELKAKTKERYVSGYETVITKGIDGTSDTEAIVPIISERDVVGLRQSKLQTGMALVIQDLIKRIEQLEK